MNNKPQAGFSLVELLIVVVIISVISIIVIPRWFGNSQLLNQGSDRLVNAILYTKEIAISNGKNAYLNIDDINNTYTGYLKNSNGDIEILTTVNINSSIVVSSSLATIEFDGLYAKPISTTGYTINMTQTSRSIIITIDANGDVTTN